MRNIHLIMPFSRHHLWGKLLEAYRPMNVMLHPLALSGEILPGFVSNDEKWIRPFFSVRLKADGFNQSALLNDFIKNALIIGDDYYVTCSDDDMYEPAVFDAIRNLDDPVVVISMKRGYHCPESAVPGKDYPPTTLIAAADNMDTGYVGGEQIFMKGAVLKSIRFNEDLPATADGCLAEHLKVNHAIRYEPELYALFNFYEPGRWEREQPVIAFGVMVNEWVRFDQVFRRSHITGETHYIKEPETATKGLNKLLDIMAAEGADIAILSHQDMHYSAAWLPQVRAQLAKLPDNWVVAGIIGKDIQGRIAGKFRDMRVPDYFDTSNIHSFPLPASCFDECCIIVNMKTGFRFDEGMTGFDLYGTLCVLQAQEMGGTAWIIDAYAEHYCLRPFTWVPDQKFCDSFKWLWEKYSGKTGRIETTSIGFAEAI